MSGLAELKKQIDKFEENSKKPAEVIAVNNSRDRDELLELARRHGCTDEKPFGCRVILRGDLVPRGEMWVGTAATLDPAALPPPDEPFGYSETISAGAMPKADA